MMLLKKTVHDELVAKVNSIDTNDFVFKTKYDTDKSEIENKFPDTSGIVKKTDYNAKITEIEGKISSISGLATTSKLTAVENKIPDVSSLVKKTDYDTKITEIEKKLTSHDHNKYITTPEFNKLSAEVFDARLKLADLVTKTDFDDKLKSLNQKINSNKAKHLLVENELNKLKTLDLSYFKDKSHFEEDGTQNYLVFQLMSRYLKTIAGVCNGNYIYYWESKGLSEEKISSIKTSNRSITPNLSYYSTKRVEFNGSCLKQDKITFNHRKIVNIYIVYEISKNINISDYLTLGNCSFGPVSLTKNANIGKYKFSVYRIGFDRHGSFLSHGIRLGKNVIIFGVYMSSSADVDSKRKDILILVKGPTQGLEHTLAAEKMY